MAPDRQLKWTRRALADLSDIAQFISQDKPEAARKLANAIRTKSQALQSTPHLGREIMPDVRELVVHRHYLLTYRIRPDCIEILQIWHTARQR